MNYAYSSLFALLNFGSGFLEEGIALYGLALIFQLQIRAKSVSYSLL